MVGWLDKERNLALSLQGEGKREASEERIIKATCFDLRRAFSSPLVFVCRRRRRPPRSLPLRPAQQPLNHPRECDNVYMRSATLQDREQGAERRYHCDNEVRFAER